MEQKNEWGTFYMGPDLKPTEVNENSPLISASFVSDLQTVLLHKLQIYYIGKNSRPHLAGIMYKREKFVLELEPSLLHFYIRAGAPILSK